MFGVVNGRWFFSEWFYCRRLNWIWEHRLITYFIYNTNLRALRKKNSLAFFIFSCFTVKKSSKCQVPRTTQFCWMKKYFSQYNRLLQRPASTSFIRFSSVSARFQHLFKINPVNLRWTENIFNGFGQKLTSERPRSFIIWEKLWRFLFVLIPMTTYVLTIFFSKNNEFGV